MNTNRVVLEQQSLLDCVARLLPHTRAADVALTGGVAIDLGLAAVGHPGSRTVIADLDFVTRCEDAVSESVSDDFLISHYHVEQPGVPKFMLQLVDPISRIRVDIFPDRAGSLDQATWFTIGATPVKVLSLESIFAHKRQLVAKASEARPIDPKHDRDARLLGTILGYDVPPVPLTALVEDVYGGDADLACRRCELSRHPAFPLAPRPVIFELLGWPTGTPRDARV